MGEIWAVTTWTVIIDPPDIWAPVTRASYWQQGKYFWVTRTSRAFTCCWGKYIKKYFLVCLTNISLLISGISRMFATVSRNWCCHATDQEVSWQVTWHIRDAAWHLGHVTLIHQTRGNTKYQTSFNTIITVLSECHCEDDIFSGTLTYLLNTKQRQ